MRTGRETCSRGRGARRTGRARPRMYLFFISFLGPFNALFLLSGGLGRRRKGCTSINHSGWGQVLVMHWGCRKGCYGLGPRLAPNRCMVTARRPPEEDVGEGGGGWAVTLRRTGQAGPRMFFPLFFPLSLFLCHFTPPFGSGAIGRRRTGSHTRTDHRSGTGRGYL